MQNGPVCPTRRLGDAEVAPHLHPLPASTLRCHPRGPAAAAPTQSGATSQGASHSCVLLLPLRPNVPSVPLTRRLASVPVAPHRLFKDGRTALPPRTATAVAPPSLSLTTAQLWAWAPPRPLPSPGSHGHRQEPAVALPLASHPAFPLRGRKVLCPACQCPRPVPATFPCLPWCPGQRPEAAQGHRVWPLQRCLTGPFKCGSQRRTVNPSGTGAVRVSHRISGGRRGAGWGPGLRTARRAGPAVKESDLWAEMRRSAAENSTCVRMLRNLTFSSNVNGGPCSINTLRCKWKTDYNKK